MVRLSRLSRAQIPGRALAELTVSLIVTAAISAGAWAAEPRPWQLGMQPPATPVKDRLSTFHDALLVIIFLISIFVMGLLLYVIVRFNHTRNPVPSRTSHNPVIEILWTVIPVLILVTIAIPSFKLMYYMDRVPNTDMTIKVTGHQWYWTYLYPDQNSLSFDSNLIPDDQLKPGQKRLLEADNPLVVPPVGKTVRVQVTSTDVIHAGSFRPLGSRNTPSSAETTNPAFKVERPGTYYGECNQICGVNHGYMPIKIVAVPTDDFQRWLVDAKKKFAHDDSGAATVRVAAAGASPAPAGK